MNDCTRLHRFSLGLIALLAAIPLAAAAESSAPPPADQAREQQVRGLRARFSLQQSDRGLLYRIIQPGSGPRARPSDIITISFAARLLNGANLSSLSASETKIKVSDLLPGLAEAAQMLPLGTKATICVMPHLSFADGPWPKGVRPGSPIFYEVEVHDIATPTN
jgi:FKBP-type peptidyl-prolyl cis-trans isomerase FkpA